VQIVHPAAGRRVLFVGVRCCLVGAESWWVCVLDLPRSFIFCCSMLCHIAVPVLSAVWLRDSFLRAPTYRRRIVRPHTGFAFAGSLEGLGCWCRVVWLVACEEIGSEVVGVLSEEGSE
jgi:hypothetical protein